MDMSQVFKNDIAELRGKSFYYSRRFAKGEFNVIKPYTHEHYELYYLIRGGRRFFIKNKIYTLNAGDFVLVKPNTLHYTAASQAESHERIVINFTEEYLMPQLKMQIKRLFDAECVTMPLNKRAEVEEIFSRIAEEYKMGGKYSAVLEQCRLAELLIMILRLGVDRSGELSAAENAEGAVDRALEFINQNLSREISLDEAAAFAGFSKSHFSKIFKEITGFTFGNYLQLQRLLKAKRLLEKTGGRITEISDECGFANSGYFSVVFKNHFGMTPLEYRKSVKKAVD